jgi:hypothetical protein
MPRQKARGPTTVAVHRAPVVCLGETCDDSAPAHTVQPVTTLARASPLRFVIEPTPGGRKWTARLGDRVLCVTASPFVKSARLLLDEGYSADAVIEMWWPNTDDWALQGRLGAVAATVMDGETASRCAKNGSPARDPERGGQRAAAGLRSCSGRLWGGR